MTLTDRVDPLGLRALSDVYAAPTAAELHRSRLDLPDDVLVSRCATRLHAAGHPRHAATVARLTGHERAVLVALERRDLLATLPPCRPCGRLPASETGSAGGVPDNNTRACSGLRLHDHR